MGSTINYLRLSVTDRCNLNCIYCKSSEKFQPLSRDETLRYEEMNNIVKILSTLGINKLRITGGEPLTKRNIEEFILMLKTGCNLDEVNLTTNGILLKEKLEPLAKAGLNRINLSLNTLDKDKYKYITGEDKFERVFTTLRDVIAHGRFFLKINVVLLKGINDDEITDFASFTLGNDIGIRFIEYFPTNGDSRKFEFVSNSYVKKEIEKRFGVIEQVETKGNGPGDNYRIKEAKGHIGFISYHTQNFCDSCNRLRLTCDGRLYPCLLSSCSLDLKSLLRESSIDEMTRELRKIISIKENNLIKKDDSRQFLMNSIGG